MTAQPSIERTPTLSSETLDFDALEAEIMRQADEQVPDLLPRLLLKLLKRDSLVHCQRHDGLLFGYVRAQIALTRAKRNWYRDDWMAPPGPIHGGCDFGIHNATARLGPEQIYYLAREHRDRLRREYRSTPCVCFKQHR